jgi:AraC-like DNA-binding protein
MVVHGFEFAPGTDGFVASFPIATLDKILAASMQASPHRALLLPQHETSLPFASPRHFFADALREYAGNEPGRSEALCGYATLLGIWFLRVSGTARLLGRPGAHARAVLLRRFVEIIERRFAEQPSVATIARELGVSAPHLTRACRELLGRPALSLVHERIVLEAKRSLVFTSMPVSQVAYELGSPTRPTSRDSFGTGSASIRRSIEQPLPGRARPVSSSRDAGRETRAGWDTSGLRAARQVRAFMRSRAGGTEDNHFLQSRPAAPGMARRANAWHASYAPAAS